MFYAVQCDHFEFASFCQSAWQWAWARSTADLSIAWLHVFLLIYSNILSLCYYLLKYFYFLLSFMQFVVHSFCNSIARSHFLILIRPGNYSHWIGCYVASSSFRSVSFHTHSIPFSSIKYKTVRNECNKWTKCRFKHAPKRVCGVRIHSVITQYR